MGLQKLQYIFRQHLINIYQLRFLLRYGRKRVKDRFIIIGLGRNGTTLLTSLINSHPDVYCDSEIFWRRYNVKHLFPFLYINSLSRKAHLHNAHTYGFKLKVGQLVTENKLRNYKSILRKLYRKGWKIIYVTRENFVKQAFSQYRAEQLELFESKNQSGKEISKILVDPEGFLDLIRIYQWNRKVEDEAIASLKYLPITYETDLLEPERHQFTANNVFRYLNLPSVTVKTDLIKLSDNTLLNNIENFKEVEACLREDGYSEFLL